MLQDIFVPFLAVGLAELGDKTQLAVFGLASKTKKYFELLAGVVLAFVIADGLAILLGDYISGVIPLNYLKITSGSIFIAFGVITLVSNKAEEGKYELKNAFISGFSITLISELGDKTQIASALFATRFNPIFVFIGVIGAMALLSLMAVYLGRLFVSKVNQKVISRIAGALFIVIGVLAFYG